MPPTTVTVDPNAIPWLRLHAVSTEGPGIFADTTFIQRVNTTGGKAPAADGTWLGKSPVCLTPPITSSIAQISN